MIYITGDCHGDWSKFSTEAFPEQKEMTREDFVVVCGDFGIWNDDNREQWWFRWLSQKNFTILFVDGNHENFDRIYSNEFKVVDFYGGKAHKIRENIYHLMRGHIFNICEKKIFAFGGAQSHDIQDGILDEKDYPSIRALIDDYNKRSKKGEMIRINHVSWWEQELPSEEEMSFGLQTLEKNNNKVDFVISHCAPQSIASMCGFYGPDKLTGYFDRVSEKIDFSRWFCGHYHEDIQVMTKYIILYDQIIQIA